jgi:hypothetical protein
MGLTFAPLLKAFAEILCFELGKCNLRLFLNRDVITGLRTGPGNKATLYLAEELTEPGNFVPL